MEDASGVWSLLIKMGVKSRKASGFTCIVTSPHRGWKWGSGGMEKTDEPSA